MPPDHFGIWLDRPVIDDELSPFPSVINKPAWAISPFRKGLDVNNIIYIIGLIVVILAVLSFFGFR